MIERFRGQLTGNGFREGWVVTLSPRGGWFLDEAPLNLPEGAYSLTFGDRHPKNPAGTYKSGLARRDGNGQWTVQDVRDA